MRSRPLESNNYETACKECLFAIYDGKTQTGCTLGRIEKFQDLEQVIDAYDDSKEFYVIKGICNAVRQSGWNNDVADEGKLRDEIRPRFDVFIDADGITETLRDEWTQFFDEVSGTDFEVTWTVVAKFDLSAAQKKLVGELLRHTNATVIQCKDTAFSLCEAVLKSRRAFTVVIDKLSLLSPNIFNRVDVLLNEDLKKFVTFTHNGTCAFSNLAFHIYQKKLDSYNFYDILEEVFEEAFELKLNITEVEGAE